MKRIIALLALILICTMLVACENKENSNEVAKPNISNEQESEKIKVVTSGENIVVKDEEKNEEAETKDYTLIKFSDMYEIKGTNKNVSTQFNNLNGKKVEIKGYPAVQSPLDESFVYLNNQPYVTCPFCTIGDITKLEVIPIYMANKGKIKYTENSLTVYGTLEVAEKVDSEGYTTQFRVYADKVEEDKDSVSNKAVNDYYKKLSKEGMIYDIQTLQMNMEYASNPKYMKFYDEKFQTGKSTTIDKVAVVKGISDEYISYDSQYANGYGSEYTYLDYIKECPEIVKECEPEDEKLKVLNNELVELYNKQIVLLEKYQNICYKIHEKADVTLEDAESYLKELHSFNTENLKQYNEFTSWNNRLRD